jgi:predicted nucleic acid-binding protein
VKLYVDSCILIYLVDGPDPLSQAVAKAMRGARGATFCLSDLVRLECLVDPIRRGDEEKRKVFEAQFQRLTCLPLIPPVFDLAAELRARHHLKTPDAIHAATAIFHGCNEFWTNDRRLAALEPRIALRVLPEVTP